MEPVTITFAILLGIGIIALFLVLRYNRKTEQKESNK